MKLLPTFSSWRPGAFTFCRNAKPLSEPPLAARKLGRSKKCSTAKDLDGWAGNETFWSVKDGCIVGQTTAENASKLHLPRLYRSQPDNFELTCKFKIKANNQKGFANSGIQYRSGAIAG